MAKEGGRGRGGDNKLIVESLTFWYVSTKTHGFVTIKKKTDSRNEGIKGNQGCALAEPGGPCRPTFALGRLENLRLFIQITCWHPGFYWSRVLGSIQFSLEHSLRKRLKEN